LHCLCGTVNEVIFASEDTPGEVTHPDDIRPVQPVKSFFEYKTTTRVAYKGNAVIEFDPNGKKNYITYSFHDDNGLKVLLHTLLVWHCNKVLNRQVLSETNPTVDKLLEELDTELDATPTL